MSWCVEVNDTFCYVYRTLLVVVKEMVFLVLVFASLYLI